MRAFQAGMTQTWAGGLNGDILVIETTSFSSPANARRTRPQLLTADSGRGLFLPPRCPALARLASRRPGTGRLRHARSQRHRHLIRRVRTLPSCTHLPVVIVTAQEERDARYMALEAGATDSLIRPVDHVECRVRCRNLLTQYEQHRIIQDRARWLERQVNETVGAIRVREQGNPAATRQMWRVPR